MLEYLKLKRWKFVDRDLHKYCHDVRGMQWARTKRALFRHLTWDSYQDLNHPYTRFKLSVPLDELWYHDRQAAYIEIENAGDLRGLGHFSK